jgi:hypothetical protein
VVKQSMLYQGASIWQGLLVLSSHGRRQEGGQENSREQEGAGYAFYQEKTKHS